MRREWTVWLGFTVVVLLAAVFVLARDDGKDNPSRLSAGTTLPTSTVAPSTTVTTLPPSTTTSTTPSTTPSTSPPTTRRTTPAPTEGTVAPTTPPPTAPDTSPPPTTPPRPQVEFGAGTYRIGIDLPAGTYHTEGGRSCFWARLSSLSGTADSVIEGESTNGGPATVTIPPTDAAFTTSGCALWRSA
ncbi:MAG: hypothetical protein QOI56_1752 [Actinomycetota bacterium]|nr:hypothetical protein [Actinomycetota bacterium]